MVEFLNRNATVPSIPVAMDLKTIKSNFLTLISRVPSNQERDQQLWWVCKEVNPTTSNCSSTSS